MIHVVLKGETLHHEIMGKHGATRGHEASFRWYWNHAVARCVLCLKCLASNVQEKSADQQPECVRATLKALSSISPEYGSQTW